MEGTRKMRDREMGMVVEEERERREREKSVCSRTWRRKRRKRGPYEARSQVMVCMLYFIPSILSYRYF